MKNFWMSLMYLEAVKVALDPINCATNSFVSGLVAIGRVLHAFELSNIWKIFFFNTNYCETLVQAKMFKYLYVYSSTTIEDLTQ